MTMILVTSLNYANPCFVFYVVLCLKGVMGLRLVAYSLLTNPWYALPIELLHGLTLGVYWSTVIYFH